MLLNTNLQGYWKLDETGGTRADSSGNNNTLADINSVLYGTGADAKVINSAAFVNANTEYLSLASGGQTGLNFTGDYASSSWVKFNSIPTDNTGKDRTIYQKAGCYSLEIAYNTGGKQYTIVRIGATSQDLEWTPSTGVWYNFVVNYTAAAGTVDFYVNGVSTLNFTGLPTSIPTVADTFYIGNGTNENNTYSMDGYIDELGIWDRLLTIAEITRLYNGGAALPLASFVPFSPFPSHYNT